MKKWPLKGLTFTSVIVLALFAAWSSLLFRQGLTTSVWNYLFNIAVALLYLFAFIIAVWHSRKPEIPRQSRNILIYFGLAALFWSIGSLIWAYSNIILNISVPYPSWADLFFLLSYPIFGITLWNLHESYAGPRASSAAIRDSTIIVVVSAVVIFAFLNRPDVSPDLGLSKNLLNVAYSLGDVMLVAIALVELRSGIAKKHRGLYLLIGFFLLQAGGDFLFAARNNAGAYWNGDMSDLLFAASALCLTLALAQNNLVRQNKHK